MAEHSKLLIEALGQYGLANADTELIRHNENMTFQVDGKYLLRIHKHKDGFTTDPIYEGFDRIQLYQSELSLISHLKLFKMNVQTPVQNLNGELVTKLSDGITATMLTWIEGHTIDKSELFPPLCRKIGEMTAKLHQAARSFQKIPALRYDGALCGRLKRKLNELAAVGAVDRNSCEIMAAALDKITELLQQSEDDFIPVHSDLSLSNMLLTEAGVATIDFSLFGYCHPMMDISALFCCIGGIINRRAITEGYITAGETIDSMALGYTFALNVLLGIILHCESWTEEDWFAGKLSGWCKDIFIPLTQDKAIISMDFHVVCAEEKDIPAWLALVNTVAEDFPGLDIDNYTETLKKNIVRKTALCIREDGKLSGILLFSPHHHCLSCMAVHPEYRCRGVASALIREMLNLMPECDINVTTFRENDAKGIVPRALYRKFGFEPDELLTEFDYPVQKFVLHRK
ncbi:MAG: GNAT family N-acetyltransferase [Oscillospiraceae bacterium]|nr:GNAT family N-acetyltransferase [Oscillospiraceae bacterium]